MNDKSSLSSWSGLARSKKMRYLEFGYGHQLGLWRCCCRRWRWRWRFGGGVICFGQDAVAGMATERHAMNCKQTCKQTQTFISSLHLNTPLLQEIAFPSSRSKVWHYLWILAHPCHYKRLYSKFLLGTHSLDNASRYILPYSRLHTLNHVFLRTRIAKMSLQSLIFFPNLSSERSRVELVWGLCSRDLIYRADYLSWNLFAEACSFLRKSWRADFRITFVATKSTLHPFEITI